MKKIIVLIVSLYFTFCAMSQTYVNLSPSVFINTTGTFREKTMATIEVGRTWEPVSVGLALGKTTFAKQKGQDTAFYAEVRGTYTLFTKNDFSAGVSLGVGHIFNAKQNFLTEFSYNIGYSFNQNISVNVFQGFYHFDGKLASNKYAFMGAGITISFPHLLKVN